ncbi:MAG: fumarylacetoacetate hydrolase family protein [Candidatus Omnitrophota bacterium]|nr:fumarylacetoacetate hydrolase family protein [Candidatus Omnitrophota bacterium]
MKILRFCHKKIISCGIVEDDYVRIVDGSPFGRIKVTAQKIPLGKIKFLPPVNPTKIILVGLNYKDHAKELNMPLPEEPVIFLKPSTALLGYNEAIVYPKGVKQLDYEAELAVIIGKEGKNIQESVADKYIFGYTCLNDVTARDLQRKDIQWTRAKSFDTFCPVGPWIETELNPSNLKIKSYLNGQLKQNSSSSNFIFSISYIIYFISKIMTLFPGDIISTGTPYGVGPMQKGDTVEVDIENIGRLKNYVR